MACRHSQYLTFLQATGPSGLADHCMLAKCCTKLSCIRSNTRRAASASANISFTRWDVSCLAGRRTVSCLFEVFLGSWEAHACSDAVGSAVSGLSDRRRQCQAVVLAFGRALASIVRLVTCTDESLSHLLGSPMFFYCGQAVCRLLAVFQSFVALQLFLKRLMTHSLSFWRFLSSSSGSL